MRLETSDGGISKSCEPITRFYDDGPARFDLEHVSIVRQISNLCGGCRDSLQAEGRGLAVNVGDFRQKMPIMFPIHAKIIEIPKHVRPMQHNITSRYMKIVERRRETEKPDNCNQTSIFTLLLDWRRN
jgi:hypothetical protein